MKDMDWKRSLKQRGIRDMYYFKNTNVDEREIFLSLTGTGKAKNWLPIFLCNSFITVSDLN